jgi:hypothetical protein
LFWACNLEAGEGLIWLNKKGGTTPPDKKERKKEQNLKLNNFIT